MYEQLFLGRGEKKLDNYFEHIVQNLMSSTRIWAETNNDHSKKEGYLYWSVGKSRLKVKYRKKQEERRFSFLQITVLIST